MNVVIWLLASFLSLTLTLPDINASAQTCGTISNEDNNPFSTNQTINATSWMATKFTFSSSSETEVINVTLSIWLGNWNSGIQVSINNVRYLFFSYKKKKKKKK